MRSITSNLATVFSVTLFSVTVVDQMVKILSFGRTGSSKLPCKNTLYCYVCPVKWQIFKFGVTPLKFRPCIHILEIEIEREETY